MITTLSKIFVLQNFTRCYTRRFSSVKLILCNSNLIVNTFKDFENYRVKWKKTNCTYSTYSKEILVGTTKETNFLKKIMDKVGLISTDKSRLKVASYLLYENVADKVNYLDFFEEFKLINTFNSWFLVTELHVWMLLVRAMAEGSGKNEDGRLLRNNIVEAMWVDVNTRVKKLKSTSPTEVKIQVEALSEQFQASLIAYDEGIMADDKELASALWRRFFEKNCEDYLILEKLLVYVREQIAKLDALKRSELIVRPTISWTPLKNIKINY